VFPIFPDLGGQRLHGDAPFGGHLCIEWAYGGGAVVGFQEKAVGRTGTQALGIVAPTKTDIETGPEQLTELFGLAAEPMPNPRLGGGAMQAQDIVQRTDAMQYERTLQAPGPFYLRLKGLELKLVRDIAHPVQPTLAHQEGTGGFVGLYLLHQPGEHIGPLRRDLPRVQTEGGYGLFAGRAWLMRVDVE